jgi:hypothetical protein
MLVRLRSCCGLLVPVLLTCGCAPKPSAPDSPAHFVRATAAISGLTAADSRAQTIATVQAMPLYRQAQQSCLQKDYAGAAHLLQHLSANPQLSAPQQQFILQQRNICLKDAGLPVPRLAPLRSQVRARAKIQPTPLTAEQADCGPRALLLVCNRLSIKTSLPQLRQQAGTTGQGTSMAGLARAAQALGLKTEGVQVSREALPELEMPAVAFVNGHHFAAVLALQGSGEQGTATIHDPDSHAEETISQERLLRLSGGTLLLVHR